MANNLLDALRQGNNQALQKPGLTDETSKLGTLLRAKSGKAVGGPEASASNLQEQQAVVQSGQQMQEQVAPQAAIQQAGLEQQQVGQQQQEEQQVQEIQQARKFDTIQNKLKTTSILNELERDKDRLDIAKDKAKLEQVGFQLRLQDKQYLDNLQREGSRSRLNSEVGFKEAMADEVLGNSKQLLSKNLEGRSVLDADDRTFRKSLAAMGVQDAYGMFKEDQKSAKQRAAWEGAGALGTAGIGAAGTYAESQSKSEYYGKGGKGENVQGYEAEQYRKKD